METKGYWNCRGGYDGSDCRRRKSCITDVAEAAARPASSHPKRPSSWSRKFNKLVNLCEPKKICNALCDAYVDFMINIADTRVIAQGIGGYGVAANDPFGIGRRKYSKEYDEKMIMETYKSRTLIMHENLANRGIAKLGNKKSGS